ncbi:hypothetical protein LPTSP3_g26500 [Leptospira kobayashii]|uniref:Outer membrane protein n=1 Tax=Leptospira kobayashii TaxID=1917830 RepID=A0ABM7UL85_9LEPT|nr:hypothetical protein [Leptospira kobayashii]BDA79720.1 hypothetical protein LPTSP3_g26500 [Leptospira kobayashii]
MKFNRNLAFIVITTIVFGASLSAQGKVEGNALRLKGGLYLGSVQSDLEKRYQLANIIGGQFDLDWKNRGGLELLNQFGAEYFHGVDAGILTHIVAGVNFNRFPKNYEWNSVYQTGIGLKEGEYYMGFTDFTLGAVLSPQANLRIVPKYVIRNYRHSLQTSSIYLGSPVGIGDETLTARGTSGLLGVGLEYDVTPTVTVFADALVYGPFLLQGSGAYNREGLTATTGLATYETGSGGFHMSSTKIAAGATVQVLDGLRVFASLDKESIKTQSTSPIGVSVSATPSGAASAGIIIPTVVEAIAFGSEKKTEIFGLKFGVTYDINLGGK